ncbi:hypothetical protein D1867_00065, partial [Acidianus infernus]
MNRILIIIIIIMILVSNIGIIYAYNNSQQKVNYIISANWLKPPENNTAEIQLGIIYYDQLKVYGIKVSLNLPTCLTNESGGRKICETYPLTYQQGYITISFNVTMDKVINGTKTLYFNGNFTWFTIIDNSTYKCITPFNFTLPYYGQINLNLVPLNSTLHVGENNLYLEIVKPKCLPIHDLILYINNCNEIDLNNFSTIINASIFVPLNYEGSYYPLKLYVQYSTPYGIENYKTELYLFVLPTFKVPIIYKVVSSPYPNYLLPNKDLVILYVNNTFGTDFYNITLLILSNSASVNQTILKIPLWKSNCVIKIPEILYNITGNVIIKIFALNITEIGEITLPIMNSTYLSIYQTSQKIIIYNPLNISINNLSVNGLIQYKKLYPGEYVELNISQLRSSNVHISFEICGIEFYQDFIIHITPQINVKYIIQDCEIYLKVTNTNNFTLSNVYLSILNAMPSYIYIGSLYPNETYSAIITPNNYKIFITIYYTAQNETFRECTNVSIIGYSKINLVDYSIIQNSNSFYIILYIKNLGNVSAYNVYVFLYSKCITGISPSSISIAQLRPGQCYAEIFEVQSSHQSINITVKIIYSNILNKISTYNHTIFITLSDNNSQDIFIKYLTYSIYGIP